MSLAYEMHVEVRGFNQERAEDIKNAANEEWPFGGWNGSPYCLVAIGQSQLCGGETEDEFAARLAITIWQANGGCCRVGLCATYLEELPYETHVLDKEEYERWRGGEPCLS